jgi:hypothetical protein
MRTPLGLGVTLILAVWLAAHAGTAIASEAQRALAEAKAALATEPPQLAAARAALVRATEAGDDPSAVAEAHFRLGALDESDAEPAHAMAHYRASIDAAPSPHAARSAAMRVQWLSARSEGEFVPLSRFLRMQRDPALAGDANAVAAFAREADAFPPGLLRGEAQLFVAERWLGPLHMREDGMRELRKVADDPAAGGVSARLAERALVDAWLADGRLDEAAREVEARAPMLDPEVVRRVEGLSRRRMLRRGAALALAICLGLTAIAVLRVYSERRKTRIDC